MNVLTVFAHPNSQSFCNAVLVRFDRRSPWIHLCEMRQIALASSATVGPSRRFCRPRQLTLSRPRRFRLRNPVTCVAATPAPAPRCELRRSRQEGNSMSRKSIGRLGCAAAILVVVASTAIAQPSDKRTYFTFTGPTAVPGATLPAGKYLFRITNDTTSRNVIQVLSGDGKTPYAMFHTIRAERRDPARDPEVRFMETAVGMPNAVRTFWYPGERGGYEFTYPRDQARLLAKGTGQPVLTEEPKLARITPTGEEVAVQPEPFKPEAPSVVGEVAPPTLTIAEPEAPVSQQARAELPKTASNLPLFAVAGLALLLGAALLRGVRLVRG